MKHYIAISLFALIGFGLCAVAASQARATNCNTVCTRIGNYQYCNTYCF